MLVSELKPCMSQYRLLHSETAITVFVYLAVTHYMDNRLNSGVNTCAQAQLSEGSRS